MCHVDKIPALKLTGGFRTLKPVKVSIIVPAFNEELLLGKSLSQIRSAANVFGLRSWEVELIVCDNNSTDRTAEIAHAAGAMVVFEPLNQIARARNRGAAAATGDWLIFVDADSYPSAELFEEVAEQIASGRCLAGGAAVRLDSRHWLSEMVNAFWNILSRSCRLLAGSFIFCEAVAFRQIGGFNNDFFCRRGTGIKRAIKKVVQGDRSENHHSPPAPVGDLRS